METQLDAIVAAAQACQRTLREQDDAWFDIQATGGARRATFQRYAAALEGARQADAHLANLVAIYTADRADAAPTIMKRTTT